MGDKLLPWNVGDAVDLIGYKARPRCSMVSYYCTEMGETKLLCLFAGTKFTAPVPSVDVPDDELAT